MENKLKVLVVDDTLFMRRAVSGILELDPGIEVVGTAKNGLESLKMIRDLKPDVITMDIDMPIMDGLEATRRIMSTTPIPIIIVTISRNTREVNTTMEALAAGALSVIEKPVGFGHPKEADRRSKLITMVKVMSQVKVVTRKPMKKITAKTFLKDGKSAPSLDTMRKKKIVAIGISSGGPDVLKRIFSEISERFPLPILVIQHITEGFLEGMVDWLNSSNVIPIHVAKDQEIMLPGHVYFGPNMYEMGVKGKKKIQLLPGDEKDNLCPSVKHLFENILVEYGGDSLALLLTGMGSDGSQELKKLRDAGATTICQDQKSSLVFGMPGVAINLGGADYIMNPEQIAMLLNEIENYR